MIFVSHSSQDRKVAQALCEAIEARGLPCWIACRDVPGGVSFQDAIVEAMKGAEAMVLVFSQNANNSDEIKKEIALAGQLKRPVIPVRTEDVLPAGGFLYELVTRQWIDLFQGWDGAVDALVARITTIVGTTSPVSGGGKPKVPKRPWRTRRLALASAVVGVAIIAAGSIALIASRSTPHESDAIAKADAMPAFADAPPEGSTTRVNAFSLKVRLGETWVDRTWARVAPKQWVETDDHGGKAYLTTVRRTTLGDCSGSVLLGDEEKTKLVFVPDKGCAGMPLKISYEGGKSWGVAGWMTDVQ